MINFMRMFDTTNITAEIEIINKEMVSFNEQIETLIQDMMEYKNKIEEEKNELSEKRCKKFQAIYEIINENQ